MLSVSLTGLVSSFGWAMAEIEWLFHQLSNCEIVFIIIIFPFPFIKIKVVNHQKALCAFIDTLFFLVLRA